MIDFPMAVSAVRQLLCAIGENPDRPGLLDTPKRVAKFYDEWINGDPGQMTAFEEQTDSMVVVSGIETWSLCEHHMLPFRLVLNIGYIPSGKLLGLSKFGRIAHHAAHRLQVQERLVDQIAKAVMEATGTTSVGVCSSGEHLCTLIRGIRTASTMRVNALRGQFRDNPAVRQEFLDLTR